jgi:hypothetical protein
MKLRHFLHFSNALLSKFMPCLTCLWVLCSDKTFTPQSLLHQHQSLLLLSSCCSSSRCHCYTIPIDPIPPITPLPVIASTPAPPTTFSDFSSLSLPSSIPCFFFMMYSRPVIYNNLLENLPILILHHNFTTFTPISYLAESICL